MPGALLAAEGVSVSFGSLKALSDVSIRFLPGEVHAVVGENGAGKSTLMNVLAGFLPASSGSVSLDGAVLTGSAPGHRAAGIEMVHQHFRLVPAFSVEENLRLGLMRSGGSIEAAVRVAESLGWALPLQTLCSDLGVGERQRVEILKALATSPRVIIFDEPTAVLSEDEISGLLRTLRSLADQGLTIILIAHKLAEVFAVADQISVLKTGVFRGSVRATETSPKQVADLMVGEEVAVRPKSPAVVEKQFECRDLRVQGGCPIDGVSFSVGFGEVLGIGGVDGNGQVELAEALAGIRTSEGALTPVRSVGYVPQDRQVDGLALSMSIEENIQIADVVMTGAEAIRSFDVKAPSPRALLKSLSGGNQQKVVLARELARQPELLVVVNPTRGLDVKAARFVLQQIRDAAGNSSAVVLISTDRDELAAASDRTLYLSKGKLLESAAEALTA